jgi:apolipoprotein N-acyltransferase
MWLAVGFSVLSGVMLTLGFPTLELYFVSWAALVPLLFALQGKSWQQAALLGFLCGLSHYLTTLYWIRYVIYHYGGLPLPLAVMILLLLCSYLAIYPATFALAANRLEGRPWLWLLGLPVIWVTLEWIRAHLLTGFPWANLGYTQTAFTRLVQISDITGVYGISWLLVLANTSIVAFLRRSRLWAGIAITFLCLIAASLYGTWRLAVIEGLQMQAAPWTVAVVQGNIDQSRKWDPLYQQETLDRYRNLSLQAAKHKPQPALIVWPETAVPFFYGIEQELSLQLNEIIREVGVPILLGSPGARLIEGEPRLLNSAYLITPEGRVIGDYAKQHLVPFGEYVPYQRILFFVSKMVEAAGNFASGDDPSPMVIGDYHRIGVLICYEAIFPYLARLAVEHGATSLVNITNDAWFGATSAPYQHKEIARWRAIEFRVPMIRAANTGISTFFDATGKPFGNIPLNEQGYLVADVHPMHSRTFYAEWGDLFAWLCVLSTLCVLFYSGYRPRTG